MPALRHTASLHQPCPQQKEKAEVSRLPSIEAAYADPRTQRRLFSAQIILFFVFFFFLFSLCLLLLLVFIGPDGNGIGFEYSWIGIYNCSCINLTHISLLSGIIFVRSVLQCLYCCSQIIQKVAMILFCHFLE